MRKLGILFTLIAASILFVSCDEKQDEKKTDIRDNFKVAVDFLGEGNYIIENQVVDYSQFDIELYEHNEMVKLPFEPIGDSKLVYNENGNPVLSNVKKDELVEYINKLKGLGIAVYEKNEGLLGHKYAIYKDNMKILFIYYEDSDELYFYIYIGNVIGERKVTVSDAKTLIEKEGVLKEKELYKDYYVISIQNESVYNNGYYEFLILGAEMDWKCYGSMKQCIYMITDGKDINMLEEGIIDLYSPTNANLVERNGELTLVCTCVKIISGDGENSVGTVVREYGLKDKRFILDNEKYTGACVANSKYAIVKIIDGKKEIVMLHRNKNTDCIVKNGNKSLWISDEK